jgi:hypothetical protein
VTEREHREVAREDDRREMDTGVGTWQGEDPFESAVARFEARERIASRVKLVGMLQLVLGGLGLVVAGFAGGLLGSLGLATGDPGSGAWLGALGAVVGGFGAVLSLPALLGGIGLLRRRAWARRLVVVLAALEVFWVPIGTVLGGITLGVLLPESVRRYFEGDSLLGD